MRFGGVVAVDHVDFTLREVELRCVIGPNGAGKSTFFNCLTGVLRPTSGEVLFRGAAVAGIGTHAIARLGVGIKTQVPNVFDGLTARDNVWTAATQGGARAASPSGAPTRRWSGSASPGSPTASSASWRTASASSSSSPW